jgi:AbiV family abortive infection protein
MGISNQYFGKLDSEKAAEGINLAIENSQRLLKDAEILFEQESYSSSVALAILSIEESGKVPIIRRVLLEEDDKQRAKEWKSFRNHLQKNNQWILPDLVSKGSNTLDELKKMFAEEAEHPKILNVLKQISLYTECVGKAKWVYPDEVITKEIAEAKLQSARILCPEKEVTPLELDLWQKYLKPVWKTDMKSMRKAIIEWNRAMEKHGLDSYDEEIMTDFVMGKDD